MMNIPCLIYSRIVDYIMPLENWNPGKLQEWKERKTYETTSGNPINSTGPAADNGISGGVQVPDADTTDPDLDNGGYRDV